MNLIDTHSHIYAEEFASDYRQAIERATECGVSRIILPAIDSTTHESMLRLAGEYPDLCLPTIGLHPTSVNDNASWREELAQVEQMLRQRPVPRFYAIGETGIDLYWSKNYVEQQREAFCRQIELSIEYDLPLIIHSREGWDEVCAALGRYSGAPLRGVFHAFSGEMTLYERLRRVGRFAFGIGGVVTFKNSLLSTSIAQMELDDMVLETDSPYLTPVPYRGKRNESAYIYYICARIAQLKGVEQQLVAEATTAKAVEIFGL